MKCMNNKHLGRLLLVALTVISAIFVFAGCDFDNEKSDGADEPQSIDLTIDNYDYYLSIDTVCTSSTVVGGGYMQIFSYKVTITGAISGIYENCSLFYQQNGEEIEHEVKLNAAGYATFSYSMTMTSGFGSRGSLSYVRVQGKILV